MDIICQKWKEGLGPIDSVLIYADGTYRAVELDRENKRLVFSDIHPFTSDMEFSDYRNDVIGSLVCEVGKLSWGGGSWEGEGWIALDDLDGCLKWLLHFEDESEPFTQARYVSGIIETVAYEYPMMTIFTIPAESPHMAICTVEQEN